MVAGRGQAQKPECCAERERIAGSVHGTQEKFLFGTGRDAASSGIRFTNFTNCAKCETTRATLLSGRYHTEVTRELTNCITMPEVLKLGGYHTIMVGKWHLGGSPLDHGFDRYFGFLNGSCNFFTGVDLAAESERVSVECGPR